jgi:hypothetical protein
MLTGEEGKDNAVPTVPGGFAPPESGCVSCVKTKYWSDSVFAIQLAALKIGR